VVAAAARVAAAAARVRLAETAYRPDVTAGLGYTVVGERDDEAARLRAPEDDGQDALALFAGVNLPIRRARLDAGVEQAVQERLAAREARRAVEADIRRDLGDAAARLPLIEERFRLFQDVLLVQAERALASAESGYGAGTAGVLDLLDSERVLLEVRVALERARADHAIAVAALEGAVGVPRSEWRPQ
jgi:outer membrane protein TolC